MLTKAPNPLKNDLCLLANDQYKYLSSFYKLFERLIFQNTLEKSRVQSTKSVHPNDRVLVVGGGDGRMLKSLPKCSVDYIESSNSMLELAQKLYTNAEVNFIHSTWEEFEATDKYDCVFFQYFLDQYDEETIQGIIKKTTSMTHESSKILVCDFQELRNKMTHRFLICLMIKFFRLTTGHSQKNLPNINAALKNSGLTRIKLSEWKNGLVFASVWIGD